LILILIISISTIRLFNLI